MSGSAEIGSQSLLQASAGASITADTDGNAAKGELTAEAVALQVPFKDTVTLTIPSLLTLQEEVSGVANAGAIGGQASASAQIGAAGVNLQVGAGASALVGLDLKSSTTFTFDPAVIDFASRQVIEPVANAISTAAQAIGNAAAQVQQNQLLNGAPYLYNPLL